MNFFKKSLLVLAVGGLLFYFYQVNDNPSFSDLSRNQDTFVNIGSIKLSVFVRDTPLERKQGLSGFETLDQEKGMLFIFDESRYHGIWMKDMNFPIDLIWIDKDFKIIGITERLTPESYPKIFEPPKPVRFVLETNVNFAATFGIEEGDEVVFSEGIITEDL